MFRDIRSKMSAALMSFALRHLGPKRPYAGEVEDVVRHDWKSSSSRLGLSRHTPWHDRFRRQWLNLRRGSKP
jgi:hypothetical protein